MIKSLTALCRPSSVADPSVPKLAESHLDSLEIIQGWPNIKIEGCVSGRRWCIGIRATGIEVDNVAHSYSATVHEPIVSIKGGLVPIRGCGRSKRKYGSDIP